GPRPGFHADLNTASRGLPAVHSSLQLRHQLSIRELAFGIDDQRPASPHDANPYPGRVDRNASVTGSPDMMDRAERVECYSMSGEWDYLLRIAVRDVADYDRFIMRGVLAHPSVANAASNFALRQVKYTTEIPV